jgi:tellurite resistance protein TehA-like permease
MGTGILATLLAAYADGPGPGDRLHDAARALMVLAWLLLVTVGGGFLVRVIRRPERLRASLATPTDRALWGTVAMGVLAVGSATLTVAPGRTSALLGAGLWVVGTVLGLATALGFTATLVRGEAGEPTLVWGLPVVPPMVSATAGAALVPHVSTVPGAGLALLGVATACFPVALALGVVVFTLGYAHHWRVAPVPLAASATSWIPLGIVGQSVGAAQALAAAAGPWLTPVAAADLRSLAVGYGVVVLAAGVPLAGWAVAVTARGFAGRMPFSPGWWALTFPIGTVSLGLHHLAGSSHRTGFAVAGTVVLAVLCGTWSLCALASARAVLTEWRGVGTGRAGR